MKWLPPLSVLGHSRWSSWLVAPLAALMVGGYGVLAYDEPARVPVTHAWRTGVMVLLGPWGGGGWYRWGSGPARWFWRTPRGPRWQLAFHYVTGIYD